jgi:uncharacterized membrane protein
MITDQIIFSKKIGNQSFGKDKNSDKPMRSIAKAFSWRVVGTLDTLVVSYIISGEIVLAASIASVDFLTKLGLYFFHERAWNKIKWGK